jgi:hypothetical protein
MPALSKPTGPAPKLERQEQIDAGCDCRCIDNGRRVVTVAVSLIAITVTTTATTTIAMSSRLPGCMPLTMLLASAAAVSVFCP